MILGFTGLIGAGKSTCAKHMVEEYDFQPSNFKQSLIDEMKEIFPDVLRELGAIYDLDVQDLFDQKPPAMRALMQNFGTDLRRVEDLDYWVNIWKDKALSEDVVVDDVRFINEAKAVRDMGGYIIRVTVQGEKPFGGAHVSEHEWLDIEPDYHIKARRGDKKSVVEQLKDIYNTIKDEKR